MPRKNQPRNHWHLKKVRSDLDLKFIKKVFSARKLKLSKGMAEQIISACDEYENLKEWESGPSVGEIKAALKGLKDAAHSCYLALDKLDEASATEIEMHLPGFKPVNATFKTDSGYVSSIYERAWMDAGQIYKAAELALLRMSDHQDIGRPSHIARVEFVKRLATIYKSTTGKEPGKAHGQSDEYNGPFYRFVAPFLECLDKDITSNGIAKAIDQALGRKKYITGSIESPRSPISMPTKMIVVGKSKR